MTINQNREGSRLVLNIEGRLDTTTAPQLETAMEECLEGVEDLVLDCQDLEYISSAGLRVLLKTQKRMKQQGRMKLTHVNETIMEVFDLTGFVDVLTIE